MSTCLGQRRRQGAGEVRIEGGIRLQVAAAAAAAWGKFCVKVAAVTECSPAPLDSFHTLKTLLCDR